jgi:hypothetical protein
MEGCSAGYPLVFIYEAVRKHRAKSVAHADYIYDEFKDWGTGGWFMCESKAKELSVLEYWKSGARPQILVNTEKTSLNS